MDSKGRMAIPTRYRAVLENLCGGELVITIDMKSIATIVGIPAQLAEIPDACKQLQRLDTRRFLTERAP